VYIFPWQPVGGTERFDARAQLSFLGQKAIGLGTSCSKAGQKLPDKRRDRGAALGRTDAGQFVGLIVHRNCDVFHIFTVFDHRFDGNGIIVATVLDAGPPDAAIPRRPIAWRGNACFLVTWTTPKRR
jgi:hypothetical protein